MGPGGIGYQIVTDLEGHDLRVEIRWFNEDAWSDDDFLHLGFVIRGFEPGDFGIMLSSSTSGEIGAHPNNNYNPETLLSLDELNNGTGTGTAGDDNLTGGL